MAAVKKMFYLCPGASVEANEFLKDNNESLEWLKQVSNIISGFETPYGMELLATVHWVMKQNKEIVQNPSEIVREVFAWNDRKKRIFKESHIRTAWKHLIDLGLIDVPNVLTC